MAGTSPHTGVDWMVDFSHWHFSKHRSFTGQLHRGMFILMYRHVNQQFNHFKSTDSWFSRQRRWEAGRKSFSLSTSTQGWVFLSEKTCPSQQVLHNRCYVIRSYVTMTVHLTSPRFLLAGVDLHYLLQLTLGTKQNELRWRALRMELNSLIHGL